MTLAIFSSVGKRGSTHIITPTRNLPRVSLKNPSRFSRESFVRSFSRDKIKKKKTRRREKQTRTNSIFHSNPSVALIFTSKNIYIWCLLKNKQ